MSTNKKSGSKTKKDKNSTENSVSQPEQTKTTSQTTTTNTKTSLTNNNNNNNNNHKNEDDSELPWVKVTNVKKIKAEVRKAKKKFLEEKKNEDEKKQAEDSLAQQQQQQSSSSSEPEVRKMKGQSLTQQQALPKKKKKTKTQNIQRTVHISNEQELVDAIILLINNLPNAAKITVSAVGDKLQEMTGHSWNKKWKKNFGPLKSFLEGRKEFAVDSKDQVALKQHKHEAPLNLKSKAKKTPVVQAKQPKVKANRPEQHVDVPARSSSKRTEVESSSSCVRIFFVLALVIAVLLFTLISLDAGLFEQFKKN